MIKYLLVILILWYPFQGYAFSPSDTILIHSLSQRSNISCCNENKEDIDKKPVIIMNGSNNYHVGQQIFYMYKNEVEKVKNEEYVNKSVDISPKVYPNGYIVTVGIGAHRVHSRKYTWNEARNFCIQEGGNLAVINSDDEEKKLLAMMRDKNIDRAWLGLHDQFVEGDWVTIKDVPLNRTGFAKWSTKWAPSINPDNYEGIQNCADLDRDGGMDDIDCNYPISFICEIPA